MIKFLIIFLLIIYLLIKFSKFILKTLFYMGAERQQKVHQERRRPTDGNVDIDYVPNDRNGSKTTKSDGEYVEYEEVK